MKRFASFLSLALAVVALMALPPPIAAGAPKGFVQQSLAQIDVVVTSMAEAPALSDNMNMFVESDRGAAQDLRLVQHTIGVTGTMPRPGPECSTVDNYYDFICENIESIMGMAGGSRSVKNDVISGTRTDTGPMKPAILRGLASVRLRT